MNWFFIGFVFIIATVLYFWAYFKIFTKYNKKIRSKMIGKVGVMKKSINPVTKIGIVRIDMFDWKAKTDDGQIIKVGTRVLVVKVMDDVLVVKANVVVDVRKGLGIS